MSAEIPTMAHLGLYGPLSKPFELSLSAIKSVLEPENPSYSSEFPGYCFLATYPRKNLAAHRLSQTSRAITSAKLSKKCGQHGRKSRLKGHKRVCPYRDCPCAKCLVVTERQKLMADQIKIRRRQRKDTLMNLTREHITSTLNAVNAAAALSAAPAFNFGNLGALFYNTALKTPTAPLLTSPSTSDASYSPSLQFPSPTSLPTILMPPSPESMSPTTSPTVASTPTTASAPLLGPLALNPATFTFPLLSQPQSQPSVVSPENAVLIQTLLAQYRLLESSNLQNAEQQQQNDCANMLIDVCGV
ncbi:unnamed protein product [Caenorhabditis auriculariae]|uniref:DM domain-containing protein n=1 Tax=Caenorhabditis auriculariae TaxID=2777116 RepID=A0A8S1HX46_9PELO|nr:unnamed protein product [Caenorhabditis auriculariae]